LDRDGRLRVNGRDWRVVAADQGRVDPAADYLFCAPDFLFPVDGLARALRIEVDLRADRAPGEPAADDSGRVERQSTRPLRSRWSAATSQPDKSGGRR
jgi:hypothetical protein